MILERNHRVHRRCVCRLNIFHISRSEALRFRSGHFVSKLVLSFTRPYNPVSPRILAGWIMSVL